MDPPKYRISGTISALEKRNQIIYENRFIEKKYKLNLLQKYFKKKLDAGYTPQDAKKMTSLYKKYLKNLIIRYKEKYPEKYREKNYEY